MTSAERALAAVMAGAPPRTFEGVDAWWAAQRALDAESPFEAAARGGAMVDRVGWAFAAGYEAALAALLPERARAAPAALCVTEDGPPHPRTIATTFEGGRLHGEKRFVTLGLHAEELLVLAKTAEGELVLARVGRALEGVTVEPLPATPFVPEIPHAAVRFDGARGEALPGDGWTDYVKPFRTVEDVHVHVGLIAWLVASGRRWGWSDEVAERGLGLLVGLEGLGRRDPSLATTHVALAGLTELSREWVAALDWSAAPEADRSRWERDRRLLDVAAGARRARRARAFERLAP